MDRGIFENPIWQNPVTFRLFFLIVGKATYKEGLRIGGVVLKRGQWVRSYRNLKNDLEYIQNRAVIRYSLSTIKRCVNQLVKENRIIVEESELGTLFTVVNYELYQGFPEQEEPLSETANEQQANSVGTALEQLPNNKNKDLTQLTKENNSAEADLIFSPWREYLEENGQNPSSAGGFLGLLRKNYGEDLLAEAILDTIAADPIANGKNPQGYLRKVLENKVEQAKTEWGTGDPNGRGAK